MKDFSVIIVTYKSYHLLRDALWSIYAFNDIGDRLEVIVVDNSPSAEDIKIIKQEFPSVIYIENENKGFGSANNVGASYAQGKYLLFLNPDTLFVQPVFKDAINIFERNPRIGVFGVKLITKEGKANQSFNFHHWLGLFKSIAQHICSPLDLFIPKHMYTCGADIFVPKKVFEDCGKFDEKIFMYGEETDLTIRINQLGYKNKYFKKYKIVHLEGGSTLSGEENKYKKMILSYKYLSEKFSFQLIKKIKREIRKTKIKKAIFLFDFKKNRECSSNIAFLSSVK